MTDDTISRAAAIDALADYIHNVDRVYSTGKLTHDDCMDAAYSVLDELPSAQQWIPCSERMPRAFETVNVTVQIPEGRYVKESALVNGIWEGINVYAKVVAWMPLPSPWEGEQNE